MLQLTTPRKQEASGQTSLTSQARGVQQEKTLLLQEQHWGPSKTFFHLGFPSETLDLIAYNEYLFQKDYYDFFIILKKEIKIHINLLLIQKANNLLIFADLVMLMFSHS